MSKKQAAVTANGFSNHPRVVSPSKHKEPLSKRLEKELKNLLDESANQEKEVKKPDRTMAEDYREIPQRVEYVQAILDESAAADARKLEVMWEWQNKEVKRLAETTLVFNSLVRQQNLGSEENAPPLAGLSNLEEDTDSTTMEMEEEEQLENLNKMKELLCDEAGFLIETNLLDLLNPMMKEQQTVVELCSLLNSFGMREEDLPKLVMFLLKYQQTEDVRVASDDSSEEEEDASPCSSSDVIKSNQVLPALKSFLEQLTKPRRRTSAQHPKFLNLKGRDTFERYFERLGNVITEDEMKLWDVVENTQEQYQMALTEFSELLAENQRLEQQNEELRKLLQ